MASSSVDQRKIEKVLTTSCYICGKLFMNEEFMLAHINLKHSYYRDSLKFTCTHCGDTCRALEDIVKHELKYHGFGCACYFCGRKLKNEDDIVDHVMSDHLKPQTFLCGICKEDFQTESAIESHCENTHERSDGWIDCLKCHFCKDYFVKPNTLFKHVNQDHWQLNTSLCKSCGQLFYSKLALERHRSDGNKCLNGVQIATDADSHRVKFQLPSHAEWVNSFKDEHLYVMQKVSEKSSKKKSVGKHKSDASKSSSSAKNQSVDQVSNKKQTTEHISSKTKHIKEEVEKITNKSTEHISSKTKHIKEEVEKITNKSTDKSKKVVEQTESKSPGKIVEESNDGPKKVVENSYRPYVTSEVIKPGEQVTTVTTDIFESEALRIKQKNMLMRCCYICCKQFFAEEFMWQHVSSKHSYYVNPEKCTCTHCGKKLPTLDKLMSHELTDHGFGNACQFCGKKQKSEENRLDHFVSKHLEAEWYVCTICKKGFDSAHNVEKHAKSSHKCSSVGVYCLKCHFCEDIFKMEESLYKHVTKDHWQLFTFLCKSCGQLFHSVLALKRHRSDRKHCLDGISIPTDDESYEIKFKLPSNTDKVNSFKEEMDELLLSRSDSIEFLSGTSSSNASTSKQSLSIGQKDLDQVLQQ